MKYSDIEKFYHDNVNRFVAIRNEPTYKIIALYDNVKEYIYYTKDFDTSVLERLKGWKLRSHHYLNKLIETNSHE
jgi:hypothetical protein